MLVKLSGALVFLLAFGATAVAQTKPPVADLELEDLMKVNVQSVFGASKFLQKVTDAAESAPHTSEPAILSPTSRS